PSSQGPARCPAGRPTSTAWLRAGHAGLRNSSRQAMTPRLAHRARKRDPVDMLRIAVALPFTLLLQLASSQEKNPGYTDTPVLPDGFRVHDAHRPRPAVVDPGPGPTTPSQPPAD